MAAALAGVLVWALAPLVVDTREAWDKEEYYNYVALISSFVFALVCYKWKAVLTGWFVGQLLWCAAFGSRIFGGDFNILMVALGLVISLFVPLAGVLAGCAVRWLVELAVRRGPA
jgi:hypothetical protein